MKKIFKWPGGKTRELKTLEQLLPPSFERLVEPFAGSAALAFHLEKPAILNEINPLICNLYRVVQNPTSFVSLLTTIEKSKGIPFIGKNDPAIATDYSLEKLFYDCRKILNNRKVHEDLELAFAFLVVRQLAFSGAVRENRSGEINIPYGWYKNLAVNLKQEHHRLLKNFEIMEGDFSKAIQAATSEDLIFLDPPYLERLGYGSNDASEEDHIRIFEELSKTKAKWLLVHCDNPLYRDLYKDFNIDEGGKDFKYGMNFRNSNERKQVVKHLYITNY
jgi:DNA adenine methylase